MIFSSSAGNAVQGKVQPDWVVGGEENSVWAVYGPAALLQRYGTCWCLDDQTRGKSKISPLSVNFVYLFIVNYLNIILIDLFIVCLSQAFLANTDLGDSLDGVEALIKKHEDFEKSLAAQEEKIKMLDDFATKLIESEHYAYDDVAVKRDQLLERRNVLYEASANRRQLLEESYKYQTFERDCDETKSWINEKLKTASDESYLVCNCLF